MINEEGSVQIDEENPMILQTNDRLPNKNGKQQH
jgi:hypothetical protein